MTKNTLGKIAIALFGVLSLTGCFLSPGKFTSELHLKRDGTFTYRYDGEILLVGLRRLASMAEEREFVFEPKCHDDDWVERPCTDEEIEKQRQTFERNVAARKAEQKEEAEKAKALLGGIDPSDPKATQEIAARLERQRGWDKVTYRDNGIFDVEFRIAGTLSHDFVFPVMEEMPVSNSFVTAILRDDGKVRIDAPGFSNKGSNNPFVMMMAGGASDPFDERPPGQALASRMEGTFAIITDGRILANNTEEGSVRVGRDQRLEWTVTPRTDDAPTALIAFD